MLTGLVAPLAPAAIMPHACCLRHQQHCHMPHDAGISSPSCCHQCCRLLAVSTALFAPGAAAAGQNLPTFSLIIFHASASYRFHPGGERSQRAPPASI